MSAASVDVERDTLTGSSVRRMTLQSGPAHAWFRGPLLALSLALAVGGCTMVQADPVDRAAIGPLSPIKASVARPVTTEATDDAAWRLRLTRL